MSSSAVMAAAGKAARLLEQEDISFFALDLDPSRVKEAATAGDSVVYGDASKREVLLAAGPSRAKGVVISFHDTPTALKCQPRTQPAPRLAGYRANI